MNTKKEHTSYRKINREKFPVTTSEDLKIRGIKQLDVIIISGDAYVDHPSFGTAVIVRLLESLGLSVGIIAQPDISDVSDISRLGNPKLFFGVSAGNVDSMVANYSSAKVKRSWDDYSAGGIGGKRPNRAVVVYCNLLRRAFSKTPIIIGGIEASLRRFTHYDYWQDKLRRSILLDSNADMLLFGSAENAIREIIKEIKSGKEINELKNIRGTAVVLKEGMHKELYQPEEILETPTHDELTKDKTLFAQTFWKIYQEQDPIHGKAIVQPIGNGVEVLQNPFAMPMTSNQLDAIYTLKFQYRPHPDYDKDGGVPAFDTVRFSINSHRGCVGGCAFCAIYAHQGRHIQSRSTESLVKEAAKISKDPMFRGHITDIGGPTANMYLLSCSKMSKSGGCRDKKCLFPEVCTSLKQNIDGILDAYKKVEQVALVKNVTVQTGIRHDLVLADKSGKYLETLATKHMSGQLRLAPEHSEEKVLKFMRKPSYFVYKKFKHLFKRFHNVQNRKQYSLEYYISSHPGCTLADSLELALKLHKDGFIPDQVQDFLPSPFTIATCMYYTGLDPETLEEIHVPKGREKSLQRALIHFHKPENKVKVLEALKILGKSHLSRILFKPEIKIIKKKNNN